MILSSTTVQGKWLKFHLTIQCVSSVSLTLVNLKKVTLVGRLEDLCCSQVCCKLSVDTSSSSSDLKVSQHQRIKHFSQLHVYTCIDY